MRRPGGATYRRVMHISSDIRTMLACQRQQELIDAAARHRAAANGRPGLWSRAAHWLRSLPGDDVPSRRQERILFVEPLPDPPCFADLLPRQAGRR